jgi:bromodomain-containing protein 9
MKIHEQVGIQVEHAYARSIARFAAKLGPSGWAIAVKKIERVLPSGTEFGRGWVVDGEPTQKPELHIPSLDNMLTHTNAPVAHEVKRTTNGEDCSANENTLPDNSRSRTSGTTPSSADNNNFSEDEQRHQPKAFSQPTINGFSTPQNYTRQNLAEVMNLHGQGFSTTPSSNIINSGVFNQRNLLNSAKPDLNVSFQQLVPPSSNSSRVNSQQQPNLALQL